MAGMGGAAVGAHAGRRRPHAGGGGLDPRAPGSGLPVPRGRADVRLARRRRLVRVAYLVCSHRDPDQVLRLLQTLRTGSPSAALLVHHDARGSLDRRALAGLGVSLVPPVAVAWGWASQLEMLLRSFAW